METKAIPEGFHSLIPDLVVRDVAEAIEFYQHAFGAKKRRVFDGPDGSIIHAEIQMGDSILFLSPEFPEMNVFSPQTPGGGTSSSMFLYVNDVDSVFTKAVSAGARVIMPLADMFWGDRAGSLVDPFGHRWMLAMHIKDLTEEEIEKAGKAMFARKP